MTARTRWVGGIVLLLVINAVAVVALITASSDDGKSRVLPEYSVESWKR